MKLPRAFFDRPTLDVARDLLGKVLVHDRRGVTTSGAIVEVEAYIGESDPACHAAPGPTKRNAPLYGPPGFSYVYLNYGIHSLVNVVTEADGHPAAVLIRALEPIDGVETMMRRRRRAMKGRRNVPETIAVADLCRGPGNLTMAMGITLAENRLDLTGDRLFIEDCRMFRTASRNASRNASRRARRRAHRSAGLQSCRFCHSCDFGESRDSIDSCEFEIEWTPRIGIRVGTDRLWRASIVGHASVSGARSRAKL